MYACGAEGGAALRGTAPLDFASARRLRRRPAAERVQAKRAASRRRAKSKGLPQASEVQRLAAGERSPKVCRRRAKSEGKSVHSEPQVSEVQRVGTPGGSSARASPRMCPAPKPCSRPASRIPAFPRSRLEGRGGCARGHGTLREQATCQTRAARASRNCVAPTGTSMRVQAALSRSGDRSCTAAA